MSPKVELYYFPLSAPCRLVEMVASIAGVELNKHQLNLFEGEHMKEDYLKINPMHIVPFIVDGDLRMNESRAIAMYLANKYMPSNSTFYPVNDPVMRAKIDELIFYDMGTLYLSGSKVFYPIFKGETKTLNQELMAALNKNLAHLNERLEKSGGKYFLGNNLTLADVTIAATMSFFDSMNFDVVQFKHLNAFCENVKKVIPKYHEINDEPCEKFRKFVQAKMAS